MCSAGLVRFSQCFDVLRQSALTNGSGPISWSCERSNAFDGAAPGERPHPIRLVGRDNLWRGTRPTRWAKQPTDVCFCGRYSG